jgi:two-component system copper resistance phosphate regulon response regulator CusR
MRILVIEDEVTLTNGIRRGLEQAHYTVEVAHDGIQGLEMALAESFSLIILDWMLPGMDGLRICEELRAQRRSIPVLMLTARGSVSDRIMGLEAGADDYLPKPFDLAELLARVKAILRRDRVHKARNIQVADLKIDTQSHQVIRGEQEIVLTHKEYLLLEALAGHEGRILSREEIVHNIWMDEDCFSNVVDVCVGQLRKKIDADHRVKLIQTVRGFGYMVRQSPVEEPD